jgi:hypothetical protein
VAARPWILTTIRAETINTVAGSPDTANPY